MKQTLSRFSPLRKSVCALALVGLSACVDDSYDLTDVDTTSKIDVKDLVVPMNMDVVTLGDVFNLKEGDSLQEIQLNGEKVYAICSGGSFRSDDFIIPSFKALSPSLPSARISYSASGSSSSAGEIVMRLPAPVKRDFSFHATGVSGSISSVDDLFVDRMNFEVVFNVENIPAGADAVLKDVEIRLPKGMDLDATRPSGSYNSSTGRLILNELPLTGGTGTVLVTANKINLPANGYKLSGGEFELDCCLDIERADLEISMGQGGEPLSANVAVDVNYSVSDLTAIAFSGYVDHVFAGSGMTIPAVDLSKMPDFLSGKETDIVLANPQVYVSVNNPLTNIGLDFTSGFTLTAIRDGEAPKTFSLDYGHIGVEHDRPLGERYVFRLSPDLDKGSIIIPEGFADPEHVMFSSLCNVLSGPGIPRAIEVALTNPKVFRQRVDKFLFDTRFPALEGNWELIAPLALKGDADGGSRIVYTHSVDGWRDTRLYDMTIERLELTLKVDNNLPLEAVLTGYPVDVSGHQIGNVTVEGARVPGNARDEEVTLYITGEVKKIDGMTFTATVSPVSERPLSPSQTLLLKDIRAKVTGYYIKKL